MNIRSLFVIYSILHIRVIRPLMETHVARQRKRTSTSPLQKKFSATLILPRISMSEVAHLQLTHI